tara:strand:+ start:120 stop:296 length:177 start_codon:yes stop_codon:yes gene_type:complete
VEIIIYIIVIIGCGYTSYNLGIKKGVRQGAENTIDVLHERKIIRYDHKGDIQPYNNLK